MKLYKQKGVAETSQLVETLPVCLPVCFVFGACATKSSLSVRSLVGRFELSCVASSST